MAVKKRKRITKIIVNELGLTGQGVEPIVVPEVERAATKYAKERDKASDQKELETAALERLLEVMHENWDKLTPEADGGVSYRYGETLILLSKKETIKMKSIHETDSESAANN